MVSVLSSTLTVEELRVPGYEKVYKITDEGCGLQAIIALHNTTLGPGLGGIRIYPYPTFEAALNDVLRLSRGMTYKSAIAEVGYGGAKSVIIADPKKKTEKLLKRFGEVVESLKGRYIAAEDVGCNADDVMTISGSTKYVVGLKDDRSSGDPSPFTAYGTFRGIQAVLYSLFGSDSLEAKRIAIQGVGSVGSHLLEMLFWAGARLVIADIDKERVQMLAKRFGAEISSSEAIHKVPCDVFAPCAMGGMINQKTVAELQCRGVAGCANNQLLRDQDADLLRMRGILYAPDFVINAGGLINVSNELEKKGYHPVKARGEVEQIYQQLQSIFTIAKNKGISTNQAAIALADYRLAYGIGRRHQAPYFHHAMR